MSDLRGAVADLRYAYSPSTGEGADGPGPLSDLLDDVLRLIPEGAVLVTEETLAAAMDEQPLYRFEGTENLDIRRFTAAILARLRETP